MHRCEVYNVIPKRYIIGTSGSEKEACSACHVIFMSSLQLKKNVGTCILVQCVYFGSEIGI